jgi:hypothetical protein
VLSKVWNLDNVEEEVHAIDRLSKPVEQLTLTADGTKTLATTRAGLSLWNVNDGKLVKYIPITGNFSTRNGITGVKVTIMYICQTY